LNFETELIDPHLILNYNLFGSVVIDLSQTSAGGKSMKRFLTFLGLIFLFSVSMAKAGNINAPPSVQPAISKLAPGRVAWAGEAPIIIVTDNRALLPREALTARASNDVIVQTKFLFPVSRKRVRRLRKNLPMIGWSNTNCYGGTWAE
jgi:hypothetical protein